VNLPRLDILLYSHDGRGLGHVSRTIAIGMALRRLYPHLRILLASGAECCRELIVPARLDWLKLPSYRTRIMDRRSRGIDGWSNYTDQELGVLRAELLKQHVLALRPRLVLCDHAPQGKHRELLPAIEAGRPLQTRWVLGIRGIVGSVPQVQSTLARDLIRDAFSGILWYGDSAVLGSHHLDTLERQLGMRPLECGYVSRLLEVLAWRQERSPERPKPGTIGCTISLPWLSPGSDRLLASLLTVARQMASRQGPFHVYIPLPPADADCNDLVHRLRTVDHVQVLPVGPAYTDSLLASRSAVIYGGYNSLTDTLATAIPAVVLLRSLRDREQEDHLAQLCQALPGRFAVLPEAEAEPERLRRCLAQCLDNRELRPGRVNLDGAEQAAGCLAAMLA